MTNFNVVRSTFDRSGLTSVEPQQDGNATVSFAVDPLDNAGDVLLAGEDSPLRRNDPTNTNFENVLPGNYTLTFFKLTLPADVQLTQKSGLTYPSLVPKEKTHEKNIYSSSSFLEEC